MKTLAEVLFSAINQKKLDESLEVLFTKKELNSLQERITIIQKLLDGKTQREIAKELGISITTVTRGSKAIQTQRKLCEDIFEVSM